MHDFVFCTLLVSDYICEGVDFSGIEIIEQDRRFIRQARKDVELQAQKMLEQGMETQVADDKNIYMYIKDLSII